MPQFETRRPVPHTPEQMFDLVADIERYPQFLPLCEARGAAVLVGGGFNSGILATGAKPGARAGSVDRKGMKLSALAPGGCGRRQTRHFR